MPVPLEPNLRRLSRRLVLGLFLDIWPAWALASLLIAGCVAVVCRLFFMATAPYLPWLWLAPVAVTLPAIVVCLRRAYRPSEVAAIADWLSGGHGVVLTQLETEGSAWADSALFRNASAFLLPQLRPWRRLGVLVPALTFLGVALLLPQRSPRQVQTALADEIIGDLETTLAELKEQQLITPEEEERFEEEIERIRRTANERVDASSWEAVDAMQEKIASGVADKQDAVNWAKDSLARFEAAAREGGEAAPAADAASGELMKALQRLEQTGWLAQAPPELRQALQSGKLPVDPKSLQQLAASLSKYLEGMGQRMGEFARLEKGYGRFDPSEFPLASGEDGGEGGRPGRGGIDRGRADAELTYGKATTLIDRLEAKPLPPGAARRPDDWAPLVELPGSPRESATPSTSADARQYADSAGQAAWRRNLAPRHQRVVKNYFAR